MTKIEGVASYLEGFVFNRAGFPTKRAFLSLTLVALTVGAPYQNYGAVKAWRGGYGENWSVALNWDPPGAPSAGDVLLFPADPFSISKTMNNDLGSPVFAGLAFAADGFALGGNPVHLSAGGIVATQFIGSVEINCNVVLHAVQTFEAYHTSGTWGSTCQLKINGNISGRTWPRPIPDLILKAGGPIFPYTPSSIILGGQLSNLGSLTIHGPDVVTLTGANSPGKIIVAGGTLRIEHELALGGTTSETTINDGATLQLAFSSAGVIVNEPLRFNDGSTLDVHSPSVDWNGPISTLGGTVECDIGAALWVNGNIGGAGGITKAGPGDLYLMASNSYSGLTLINQGTLHVGNAHALGDIGEGSLDQGTTICNAAVLSLGSYWPDLPRAIDVPGEALRFSGTRSTLRYYGYMNWFGRVTVDPDCTGVVWGSRCSDYPDQKSWMHIPRSISGTGDLLFLADEFVFNVELNGVEANTLSGVTRVAGGRLYLVKPAGTPALNGPLEVYGYAYDSGLPGVVSILADGQLGGPSIAMYDSGYLHLNGHQVATQQLFMRGGWVSPGPNGELYLVGGKIFADDVRPGVFDYSSGIVDPYGEGFVRMGGAGFGEIEVLAPNTYLTIGASITNFFNVYNKTGAGRLILTGNINRSRCRLNQGTLEVNGDQPASVVQMTETTVLRGSGRVGGVSAEGGFVSPGASSGGAGRFTTGTLSLGPNVTFGVALNGSAAGADYGQLKVYDHVGLGSSSLEVSAGFVPAVDDQFIIVDKDVTDPIVGTFAGLPQGSQLLSSGIILPFRISYFGGDGNDVVLTRLGFPTVTVSATDPSASEAGADSGTFTFSRTEPTIEALTINVTVGGTATSGTDYTALVLPVTFAANSATATRTVTVTDDMDVEADETVIVTISSGVGYNVGTPSSGTVIIKDDDTVAPGAIVVDNADATGVTYVGTWTTSTATPGYYASNYRHDGNTGKGSKSVTFTPNLPGAGTYQVYMWYPARSDYAGNVPVDVVHAGGTATVAVNQKVNGGKWNLLGSFNFNAGTVGSVLIPTTGTSGYVAADAVKFVPAEADIVVDNANATGVTYVGTWATSTATPGYYASNYRHDSNTGKGSKSVKFTPNLPSAGTYQVYMWYPGRSDYAGNVPVDIVHAAGTATVPVNQKVNGGKWNSLGTYSFNAGTSGYVLVRTAGTTGYVVADAVKFLPSGVPQVSVAATDPAAAEPADDGTFTFTRTAPLGAALTVNLAVGGTATSGLDYTPLPSTVTFLANSATASLTVAVVDDLQDEANETVTVTLQNGSGYTISGAPTATVTIVDNDEVGPTEVIMDNADPSGVIYVGSWSTSFTTPGFYASNYRHDGNTGKGTKSAKFTPSLTSAGLYEVFIWYPQRSDYAGNVPVDIVHAAGTTTVLVNQKVNGNKWNSLGTFTFNASGGYVLIRTTSTSGYVVADAVKFAPAGVSIVVDNADAGFTCVGTWSASTSTPGFYGSNYRHDANAAKGSKTAKFTPNLPSAGLYEVFIWYPARTDYAGNVPVDIVHTVGSATASVNQKTNGKQWNSLGSFNFGAGTAGYVLMRTAGTSGYVIADAVKWVKAGPAPLAAPLPMSSSPLLQLTRGTEGDVFLEWPTVTGWTYFLQSSFDGGLSWHTLFKAVGDGAQKSFQTGSVGQGAWFRVEVVPSMSPDLTDSSNGKTPDPQPTK